MGGAPKGLERVGGKRIVDRVVSALQRVTPEVVLSANHVDAPQWLLDVPIVADKSPIFGGLSGILAALSSDRDVLVVAWDMPFVSGELLRTIVAEGPEHSADAAVPESNSPIGIEPFCAWYSAGARRPLEDFLNAGGGSARDFVGRLPRVRRVPMSVTRQFGDPGVLFLSVNTPEDLARARAIAEAAE